MRRTLVLSALLASSAFAQTEEAAPSPAPSAPAAAPAEEAPKPAPAKPSRKAAPAESAEAPAEKPQAAAPKAPAVDPAVERNEVADEAKRFFVDMLSSDARSLAQRAAFPFVLEDRRFDTEDELFAVWLKNLREKRTDLLTLYGVEVLTPADMEKKYGKPPARLAQFPYKAARSYVVVGNLSGHAAVVVFRQVGTRWKAAAYHD